MTAVHTPASSSFPPDRESEGGSDVSATQGPGRPTTRRTARTAWRSFVARRRPAERDLTQIDSLLDLSSGLWPWLAGANVVMQLANPAVGHGVAESRVESGRVDRHPIKRGRTTGLYLAVATLGSQEDRDFIHHEVKRIHDEVISTSDSPVRYSANSQQLQLWVALCLIRFFVDQYELLYRPLTDAEREHVLALGEPLATVLNVKPRAWPATWDEYESVFVDGMGEARFAPPVREMLDDLCAFGPLDGKLAGSGTLLHRTLGPIHHSYTRFGIPAQARDRMEWEISPADLRRKRAIHSVARVADTVVPTPLRKLYTVALWDMRTRRALGIDVF